MDGREGRGIPDLASFFTHRGMGSSVSGSQPGIHGPPGLSHTFANFNPNFAVQTSAIENYVGGGSIGSAFHAVSSPSVSPDGVNVCGGEGAGYVEQVKKRKRGRPRKYGPDGTVALGLPSMASMPSAASTVVAGPSGSGPGTQSQKRGRGRPPGSGRKQQLASFGPAGIGFTPHVITIPAGEDIASKIMSFSQEGPRTVCILSANGVVSTVTLHQTTGSTVTYEDRYEILNLSGSYFSTSEGGSRSRSGSLSVSLSSPDGHVIGGSVAGLLTAASSVQVILGSFIHNKGKSKTKNKKRSTDEKRADLEEDIIEGDEQSMSPNSSTLPGLGLTPSSMMGGWPGDDHDEFRNAHVNINLMRG